MERRTFIKLAVGSGLVGAGLALGKVSCEPRFVRPPGAAPENIFLASCIRCGKCYEICPIGSIKMGHLEDGLSIGTPYIDTLNSPCNLCMKCIPVCPTGALQPIDKNDVRMGVAEIDYTLCVARQGDDCRTCHGNCPNFDKAIKLEDRKYPYIDAEYCWGCGMCEHVCVADPKAIKVKALPNK